MSIQEQGLGFHDTHYIMVLEEAEFAKYNSWHELNFSMAETGEKQDRLAWSLGM
jgi:hypothetical protein